MLIHKLALTFIVLFSVASLAHAQTNAGQIKGLIKDHNGAIIPNCAVSVTNTSTNIKYDLVTDGAGQFRFPSLPVGQYTVHASATGFQQLIKSGIDLHLGQVIDLNLELAIGELTVVADVTTTDGLLATATGEVSEVIDKKRVAELPLNGRQFLQLALLSEGVVKPPGGTRGSALQQAGELVNVAGQRSGHNIYLIDGVKVTDEYFNNLVINPSVDSIQEFKIQKTLYAAEFGGKASALVNVATKSGTKSFHGNAFEFLRNARLDSKNFFDDPTNPIPPFKQNQFGATFGGPLIPQQEPKTFFFLSYEGQRIRQSLTKTFSVPTAAMRKGDLSAFNQIFDPLTTDVSGNRTPLPGNQINPDRLDPVAVALLAKIPLPNLPGISRNLLSTEVESTNVDGYSIRIDHQASAKDTFFGRVSGFHARAFQPFGSGKLNEAILPGFGRDLTTKAINLGISYTHFFSPEFLNETRFGYLHVTGGQASENQGVDFAGPAGLQGVTGNPADAGYPQVSLGGLFSNIGDPTSFVSRRDTSFEFYDNVFLNRGAHKLKFGVYFYHLSFNPVNPDTARGAFTFTGQFSGPRAGQTGNPLADFLLGYPGSGQVGLGRSEENGRSNWLHAYVQDDWNPTSNLTFNVGLRVEINQPMRDTQNRLSSIDPIGGRFVIASDDQGNISPAATELLPFIPLPFVTSSAAGWDRSLLHNNPVRFAPRFSFSWKLPGKRETVLRGGYGIFMNQWAYSVQQALARNLPFFLLKNINFASDTPTPSFTTQNILTSTAIGTIGGNGVDHDYSIEYSATVGLSLQHQITPTTVIEFSYTGSNVQGADSSTVRNVPLPGAGPIAPRRPIPQLASFTSLRWDGYSIYHAGTVRIEKRLSRGFSFNANYTFSKAIDDSSDPGATTNETNLPQDVRDLRAERGLSSFHHAHRFVASGIYELPFGKGKQFLNRPGVASAILGGWRLTAIATMESGAPFTVNDQTDRANIGQGPAQRPVCLRDPNLPPSEQTVDRFFDTSAFVPAAFGSFGNCGRNIVIGPGTKEFDLAAARTFRFNEAKRLEFRIETFNLFNTTNFDLPNRFAFTPNFGKIFSAGPARQIQLGLKFTF